MESPRPGAYLATLAILAILLMAAVGTVNWLVDPYFVFRHGLLAEQLPTRPEAERMLRSSEPLKMVAHMPRTVVFGASHVQMFAEIDVPSTLPRPYSTFKITSLFFHESPEYIDFLLRVVRPDVLIYSTDLRQANDETAPKQFRPGSLLHAGRWEILAKSARPLLFSETAIRSSIAVLSLNKSFITAAWAAAPPQPDAIRQLWETRAEGLFFSPPSEVDGALEKLQSALLGQPDWKGKLIIVIPPSHAWYLELIKRAPGRWQAMEHWKRAWAEFGARHGVPVWDFLTYSPAAVEAVQSPMTYSWDPIHANYAWGQMVVDCIAGRPCAPDLGASLTPDNVSEHLAAQRNARQLYAATRPDEMKWLDDMARRQLSKK